MKVSSKLLKKLLVKLLKELWTKYLKDGRTNSSHTNLQTSKEDLTKDIRGNKSLEKQIF